MMKYKTYTLKQIEEALDLWDEKQDDDPILISVDTATWENIEEIKPNVNKK